jgi:hypothetical protein
MIVLCTFDDMSINFYYTPSIVKTFTGNTNIKIAIKLQNNKNALFSNVYVSFLKKTSLKLKLKS